MMTKEDISTTEMITDPIEVNNSSTTMLETLEEMASNTTTDHVMLKDDENPGIYVDDNVTLEESENTIENATG